MILQEIVHTCSNASVARAALISIGGEFAARFAEKASRRGLSAGLLAADLVKRFSHDAIKQQRDRVDAAARGSDQPILSGLRYILSLDLSGEDNSALAGEA